MATKTITTYEHTCDLCGQIRDEEQLVRIRPDRVELPRQPVRRADVCGDCRTRPIGELLDLLT